MGLFQRISDITHRRLSLPLRTAALHDHPQGRPALHLPLGSAAQIRKSFVYPSSVEGKRYLDRVSRLIASRRDDTTL